MIEVFARSSSWYFAMARIANPIVFRQFSLINAWQRVDRCGCNFFHNLVHYIFEDSNVVLANLTPSVSFLTTNAKTANYVSSLLCKCVQLVLSLYIVSQTLAQTTNHNYKFFLSIVHGFKKFSSNYTSATVTVTKMCLGTHFCLKKKQLTNVCLHDNRAQHCFLRLKGPSGYIE